MSHPQLDKISGGAPHPLERGAYGISLSTITKIGQEPIYSVNQQLHQEFAQPLNVVIIAKTNLRTQARAHVVLFSSDLALASAPLVDYYSLRFQIELNFRDAKQYWGLEDSMNVTPIGVTNAANLSLFMVNVAYRLRADVHPRDPDYSILDLKADCRGYKYVEETIKLLPEKPEPVLFAKILNQVVSLGRIHVSPASFSFS
jgi:putative transposase